METKFKPTDVMPLAALSIGDFKLLLREIVFAEINLQIKKAESVADKNLPETLDKSLCSKLTGYSVNTINRMVCKRRIPFYKRNARVIFKRNEVMAWLLSHRVKTIEEFIEEKENELYNRKRKRL